MKTTLNLIAAAALFMVGIIAVCSCEILSYLSGLGMMALSCVFVRTAVRNSRSLRKFLNE